MPINHFLMCSKLLWKGPTVFLLHPSQWPGFSPFHPYLFQRQCWSALWVVAPSDVITTFGSGSGVIRAADQLVPIYIWSYYMEWQLQMSLVELAAIAKQQSFGGHMVIASLVLYTRDMLLGSMKYAYMWNPCLNYWNSFRSWHLRSNLVYSMVPRTSWYFIKHQGLVARIRHISW